MEANEGKWRNGVTSIGVTKHTQINMACSHPKTPILGVRTPLKSINNLLGQTEQTQLVSKVPPMRIKAESIQRKRFLKKKKKEAKIFLPSPPFKLVL